MSCNNAGRSWGTTQQDLQGARMRDKDPVRPCDKAQARRGHGGNWRRKTVEVVIQIFPPKRKDPSQRLAVKNDA